MNWAKDIGDEVLIWVKTVLKQKQHQEQAYRVCLGLLNLSRRYPAQRLNQACAIANKNSLYRLKHIKDILLSNQDQLLPESKASVPTLPQPMKTFVAPKAFINQLKQ